MKIDLETIIMELVVNSGNARSLALEAIALAGRQEFELAETKLKICDETLSKAHGFQTDIITAESRNEEVAVSLLLVHGQDHLMNAMTVRELAEQMIQMYRVIYNQAER